MTSPKGKLQLIFTKESKAICLEFNFTADGAELPKLLSRLTRQLASRGVKGAKGMAAALLKKRGQMDDKGNLTAKGKKRQSMGAAGRAKDRAAKSGSHSAKDYSYNKKTNRATLKK